MNKKVKDNLHLIEEKTKFDIKSDAVFCEIDHRDEYESEACLLEDDSEDSDIIFLFSHFGLGENKDSNFALNHFCSFFKTLTALNRPNEKYLFIGDAVLLFDCSSLLEIIEERNLYEKIYLDMQAYEHNMLDDKNLFIDKVNCCDNFDIAELLRFADKVISL